MGTKVDKKNNDSLKVKKSSSKVTKVKVTDDSLKVKKSGTKVAEVKVTPSMKPDKSEKKKEKVKTTVVAPPISAKKKSELPVSLTVTDVIGKVIVFNGSKKFGWIKRNDAKDGDRDIYFRGNDVLCTPGLEVQFDMKQTEKGPRAENVKILETPENKALKDCIEKNRVVEKEVSGTVTFRHKNKTFGFIKRENEAPKTTKKKGKEKKEEKIYFCENAEKYRPGMNVRFDIALTDKGPRAVNLEVYGNDDDNDNEDSEGGDGSEDGVDIETDDDSEDGDDIEEGGDSEDGAESDDGDNNDSEDGDGIGNDNDSESGDDIEDNADSDESDEPEPPKKKKKTKK